MSEAKALPAFDEAGLASEVASLAALLGDTRVRFHHRQTQPAALQKLIDVDLEIRGALASPPSAELQLEVRSLLKRLRQLDPQ